MSAVIDVRTRRAQMIDVRRGVRQLGVATLVALLATGGVSAWAADKVAAAKTFPSPKDAVEALLGAVTREDAAAAMQILGPEGKEIVFSGDPTADRGVRKMFVEAAQQQTVLVPMSKTVTFVEVGPDGWPFPIPLVKGAKGWFFDTAAGKEEILARRIGRNELRVMALCRGFVTAELDYARTSANGSAGPYAQKLLSTEGTRDGLYWPAKDGEPQSPLGPLAAEAAREGYGAPPTAGGGPRPFHGYFFKILTAQGEHAPGGARSYLVDGKMTGGFALVAWPAEYRASGIVTFLVNQNGIVFEKDLGAKTAELASAMSTYDPDTSWKPSKFPGAQ
jgi:hypothetical protein